MEFNLSEEVVHEIIFAMENQTSEFLFDSQELNCCSIDKIQELDASEEKSRFDYYEDDGISFDYKQGKYALSEITLIGNNKSVILTVSQHTESRVKKWRAVFAVKTSPQRVVSGGKDVPFTWNADRQEISVSEISPGTTIIEF